MKISSLLVISTLLLTPLLYADMSFSCIEFYHARGFVGKDSYFFQIEAYLSNFNRKISENPFDIARKLRTDGFKQKADMWLDSTEQYLQTDLVKSVKWLGGGVNRSYRVKLSSGLEGVFKPINIDRPNQIVRERVAYQLSRLLGLDIVPVTVVRKLSGHVPVELEGVYGSFQLFIRSAESLSSIEKRTGRSFNVTSTLSGRRLRIFDWLINNHDRGSNRGNYLMSPNDNYLIGIDHSVAFVGHDKQARADKVPYYKSEYLFDSEFYLRLTSVSESKINNVLRDLNPVRIDEFMERYHKLITEMKDAIDASKE